MTHSIYNEILSGDQNRRNYAEFWTKRHPLPNPHQTDILTARSYYDETDNHLRYNEAESKNLRLERKKQYFMAFGLNEFNRNFVFSLATQLGFIYFGAMIQARKQFIPGFLFFRNSHYNWIGGLKYMAMGAAVGALIMTFNFGQPFYLEDVMRNKLRKWTRPEVMDRGKKFK